MSHVCRAWSRALILLVLVSLISIPICAQTVTGTLKGTVIDDTGAALPGVTVTIRNVSTGLERIIVTSANGLYSAPFLPVGRYNVKAELDGFRTITKTGAAVELNTTTVQDFTLKVATIAEAITVTADAPRINTTDGEVKQTMRATEIMTLPSPNQTSFLRLAATFGGYMENPTSGQDNPTLSSGSSVNFNGAGTRGTTFQINGVNNDDSSENQHRQGVPLATIQSFQVLSNAYSAEFGRGYGAVVLVQTKSGTNDVDGEIYGYGQDNKYISRDALTVSLGHGTHYRRQYGLTAGFPIIQDSLFGFVSGDHVQDQGSLTATRGVFLDSDLDPAKRLTLGNDTPANRAWQDSILAHFPKAAPNAPSIATRAYQSLITNDFPDKDYSGRLDYNATLNNSVTARYQRSHQLRTPGEIVIGEAAMQNNRQSNFGMTWTNILSSDTVQEARIGIGLRSTNVNIGTGNDTPVVRFGSTGVPTFTILGNAGSYPINRNQRDNQLVYNINSAKFDHHTLKGGVDLRKSRLNDRADNFNRGYWNFTASCGGVTYPTGIQAFWAGCVNSYTIAYGPNDLKNEMSEQNLYAEDDWRPTDNLTLNLGGRFERVAVPKEADDKISYGFNTTTYVDPRLGFAYSPSWEGNRFLRGLTGGAGRFSVRGGFGIYHGRVFQSVFSQSGASIRFNPPNAISLGFTNSTNLADPTNGYSFVPGTWPTARVSYTTVDPHLKMPETHQWNLTFERQIFWNSRLRASYIGTLGRDLLQIRYDNLPVLPAAPGTQGAAWVVAQDWRCAGTGTVAGITKNATCPNDVPLAANEVSLRVPRNNERRPDQRFGTNYYIGNLAKSWYHAGQLEWELGQYHGLGGRVTYTFSKGIDTGSEATSVGTGDLTMFPLTTPGARDFTRGLSRFDTRHRMTMIGSYSLPWLKDRGDILGAIAGGWTISSVVRLASGTPYTISDGGAPDFDFDGVTVSNPVCVDKKYCGGWHVNSRNNGQPYIPASAFRHPVYGDTLADLVGRNTYYTDGNANVDLGVYKSFALPARTSVMVRLDVFNVFNHVTWGFPVTDVNASNFSVVNTTNYTPRTMQLGVRFLY